MSNDEALVAKEIERRRAAGTSEDVALANLLADVPVAVAAEFIRDELHRALGGPRQQDRWLRIQELNWLAHRKRHAERRPVGPVPRPDRGWPSLMASLPDE